MRFKYSVALNYSSPISTDTTDTGKMEDFHHGLLTWSAFDLTCKPGVLELHGLSGHVSAVVSGAQAVAVFPCFPLLCIVKTLREWIVNTVFGIMQWKPSFTCCKQGCHADSINHLTTGTKAGYGGQLRRLSSSLLAELDEGGRVFLSHIMMAASPQGRWGLEGHVVVGGGWTADEAAL